MEAQGGRLGSHLAEGGREKEEENKGKGKEDDE